MKNMKLSDLPTLKVPTEDRDDVFVIIDDCQPKRAKWRDYTKALVKKIIEYRRLGFMAGLHSKNLEMYEKYIAKQKICFTEIKKQLGIGE